jgi:cytochrome c553
LPFAFGEGNLFVLENKFGGKVMQTKLIVFIAIFTVAVSFSVVSAMNNTAAERGKTHFNNPSFAGGKKACNACHYSGRGLENAGAKTKFTIMGGEQNSLEEAINVCIINANRGQAIPADSQEMQDIVSYIKSLGK